jgi:hypothetical protein
LARIGKNDTAARYSLPAFRGLGEAEPPRIAGLLWEMALAKGETVYKAGDDADVPAGASGSR